MTVYNPYTYLIGWSKLDYWYYGCQHGKNRANPNDLWTKYFTSSKYVAMMREWHGEPDVIQVRRIFKSRDAALRCEERVLDKVGAVKSDRWLNKGNAGKSFRCVYQTPKTIEKIRQAKFGNRYSYGCKHSPEANEKKRLANIGNKNSLGNKQSPETIEKRRLKLIGRKRTVKHKELYHDSLV